MIAERPLREILREVKEESAVDPLTTYRRAGVLSYGRGLFHRGDLPGADVRYPKLKRLRAGQLVYSRLFAWEGAFAVVTPEFDGTWVSAEFPTFEVLASADVRWVNLCVTQKSFWQKLSGSGLGQRRRRVQPDEILARTIPLPDLVEQLQLVERSGRVMNAVERIRELLSACHARAQSLCEQLLIHKTHRQVPLSQLLTRRQADERVEPDSMYEFAGVYCFGRGMFRGQRRLGSEFKYSHVSRLSAGDVVYPKLMAWEGAVATVPQDCAGLVVSPEFPVFSVDSSQILPECLDVYLRSPRTWPKLANASTGTNVRRRRLHPSAFLRLSVPVPDEPVQAAIRDVCRQLDKLHELRSAMTDKLSLLEESCHQHAVAGTL